MSPMESKTSLRTSSEVSSLLLNKPYLFSYEGWTFKGSGVKRVYNINLSIFIPEKARRNIPHKSITIRLLRCSYILGAIARDGAFRVILM